MESLKLHLLRLARRGPVEVPGLPLRAYPLLAPEERPPKAFYLLLEGELVIDLPEGRYLHLKRGEAAWITEPHRLLPVEGAVLLELPA
ncbi:hypothetical protein GCM10007092_10210 [Thermus composti]|uniref:AraC family transcriptional regulator n=1 Tax=Thermus composti TaxID=532059 RepID=A0ABV6Q2A4_9DEIN|nr:hypothetical protein [Thermus composti]GGM98341.1 hypothetical protein GCM10007092_10210 [Thermus composti]